MNDAGRICRLKVVLASASPQRRSLLSKICDEFEVIPSGFDEKKVVKLLPEEYVKESAQGKAMDVANRIESGCVIGSDTIVVLGSDILGKPTDNDDAYRMLNMLSGKTHSVYTGICAALVSESRIESVLADYERTYVIFKKLSREDILNYIDTGEPIERAGAYAIQEKGYELVDHYDGDFDNIVGLPVEKLRTMLEQLSLYGN